MSDSSAQALRRRNLDGESASYKLIVDRLMLRDMARSPLSPTDRRRALQQLALRLSARDVAVASETTFAQIVDSQFGHELRRLSPEDRRTRRVELFEDLRSSATLTRATNSKEDGWVFSHNSLREFLAVEIFLVKLLERNPIAIEIPVSEAMRSFVSSLHRERLLEFWRIFGELWTKRATDERIGGYLALLWDSAVRLENQFEEALSLLGPNKENMAINDVALKGIDFSVLRSASAHTVNASNSNLSEVRFDGLSLRKSNFRSVVADTVSFRDVDLSEASFESAFLYECDFSGSTIQDANFQNIDADSSIIVASSNGEIMQLSGRAAIGYLKFGGAHTSPVDDVFVYVHHPKYSILEKICEKVSEQRNSQLRGLTQRGESRADPPFARELVDRFVSLGWMTIDHNDLVSATPRGRPLLQRIVAREALPAEVVEFLNSHPD